MTNEHDDCRVTVDGVAPAVVVLLRKAAEIAASHGRRRIGFDDVHAALITHDDVAPLWWPRPGGADYSRHPSSSRIMYTGSDGQTKPLDHGILHSDLRGETEPLTFDRYRELVLHWVPGPTPDEPGPVSPATITYELTGPHADDFRKMIERR